MEAGPHPINAIFAFLFFGGFKLGLFICFTFISRKKLTATSCSLLMLMGPCSSWKTLQEPAHSWETGQSIAHDKPKGLLDKMVLAAPYQFRFSIW